MKKEKGKSLAIFSSKGGVGKSTLALNMSGIASKLNKKTLLIDFDLTSGGIAAYVNRNYQKSSYNLMDDVINNTYKSIDPYVIKYNEYLDILPCPKDPRQGAKITCSSIKLLFEKLKYEYDYIIIDLSHTLTEFNVTVLDLVDMILVVMTNDLIDLKNTHNLIKIFEDGNKDNYRILLNNSINPYKKYYGAYDIKTIIKSPIHYNIGSEFFLKSIDTFIADSKIVSLDNKFIKAYPKVNITILELLKDLDGINYE